MVKVAVWPAATVWFVGSVVTDEGDRGPRPVDAVPRDSEAGGHVVAAGGRPLATVGGGEVGAALGDVVEVGVPVGGKLIEIGIDVSERLNASVERHGRRRPGGHERGGTAGAAKGRSARS